MTMFATVRTMRRIVLLAALFGLATVLSANAADDSWSQRLSNSLPGGWGPPDHFVFHSPADATAWRFGAFAGQYNSGRLLYLEFEPWRGARLYKPGYVGALNATYKAVDLPYLPVEIGLDFALAQHFGGQSFSEVAFAPTITWNWFPWNNYVYTRFRMGPLGVSYDTAVSKLEAADTVGRHTSRFLNYHVAELIFSPAKDANWEVFLGVHHRCGIYGLVGKVNGGSNYVTAGFRAGF